MSALNGAARRALRMREGLTGAVPSRSLAVLVLMASCGAGLAYSGDSARIVDAVGRAGGFALRSVELSGQKETSDSAILASIGLHPGGSLIGLDLGLARARLEALPWVTDATVRKVFPGTLKVAIDEAAAAARWSFDGRERLVAATGDVLADDVPYRFRELPLVAGEGANLAVEEAKALLSDHPQFAQSAVAMVRVNERRWDLRLEGGATVKLPEVDPSAALDRLARLEAKGALLASGSIVIDLRLADRTTVDLRGGAEDLNGDAPILVTPDGVDPLAEAIAQTRILDPLAAAVAEGRAADPLAAVIAELGR